MKLCDALYQAIDGKRSQIEIGKLVMSGAVLVERNHLRKYLDLEKAARDVKKHFAVKPPDAVDRIFAFLGALTALDIEVEP